MRPVPWCNGAGTTPELAAETGPEGEIRWRISLAELNGPAEFSIFAGLDRLFFPLGAMRLTVDGAVLDVQQDELVRFKGESSVAVVTVRPTEALNVMVRRGALLADLIIRPVKRCGGPRCASIGALGTRVADIRIKVSEPADE